MEKHYIGHRQRLKEKFRKSANSLLDYELAEVLLSYIIPRRDVKMQAKELAEKSSGFAELFSIDVSEIKGLGNETALFFDVLKEVYTRMQLSEVSKSGVKITSGADVAGFLSTLIGHDDKESFAAIFIGQDAGVLSYYIFNKGTVNEAPVYPREIAEKALKEKAVSVIISHNHPGGSLKPSSDDIDITDRINSALKALDIKLLDHIIVSGRNFYSFRKELLI